MGKEFMAFLKQYGVIGLAIAVVIGGKANDLVGSIVKGLLMPVVGLIPIGGDWQGWGFDLRGQHFAVGPILSAGLDFLIVAGLIFWFSKKVLKEETVTKK
jgi:large conductance mechanosensitive channel